MGDLWQTSWKWCISSNGGIWDCLCIHGEKHGLKGPDYFDSEINAERSFYEEDMVKLAVRFPKLKIVAEHMTTKEAVAFVKKGWQQYSGQHHAPTFVVYGG